MQNDHSDLDRFDRAILNVLSEDGRISIADLARRIGLSKSPTQARLRRLEKDKVITGYRALVDPIREIVADARIFVRLVVTGLSGEVSVSAVCDRSAGPETFERSAGAEYVCTEDTVWVAVGRQTAAAVG